MNEEDLAALKERIGDRVVVASVSGGKDSTAMCLHLKELGIPYRSVFCDTGWENEETYRYLKDYLPKIIGPIEYLRADVPVSEENRGFVQSLEQELGFESAMVRLVVHKGMIPGRIRKFCTQSLKIEPVREFLDGLDCEPISVVGVRAAESKSRSVLPEWEENDFLDVEMWRPLIRWSEQNVIDIHTRHGVLPNPNYLNGAERVGCWPCIFSRKSEIRRVGSDDARISVIRQIETHVQERMETRMAKRGKVPTMRASWFFGKGGVGCVPIDEVIKWSQTQRGGRQFELFGPPKHEQGCMRWGLCDMAAEEE